MTRLATFVAGLLLVPLAVPPGSAAAAQRTKVTAFIFAADGLPSDVTGRISRAVTSALRSNERLDVEDSDKLLVEYSGELPRAKINAARRLSRRGLATLESGKPAAAMQQLKQALRDFDQVLAFVKKREIARTALALGVAQALLGQTKRAQTTFEELLTWRARMRFDTESFPPRLIPLFEHARQAVKRKRRGSVELLTTPAGARAYVDGRFVGVTPTTAFGLTVGHHLATFKKAGYVKAAQTVQVSPTEQKRYTAALHRSAKILLLERALATARRGLGQPKANAGMRDLRSVLFVDHVVFINLAPAQADKLKVEGYVYDLRSNLRLNQVSSQLPLHQPRATRDLVHQLYLNVRYDGTLEAPKEPPPPPPEKRTPFYASWWFWTAVGAGVTAAVVLPITLWPDSDTCGGPCVNIKN